MNKNPFTKNIHGKMNKKAMIFMPMITIVILGVLAYGLLQIQESKIGKTKYIGEKQGNLIKIYDSGEKALFYTEQAAKLANLNALKRLGENGGVYESKEECREGEYIIWSSNCLANYKEEFLKYFNDELNKYLINYPVEIRDGASVSVLKDQNVNNYALEIEKGVSDYNLTGKAKKKLVLFQHETKYYIEPSFKLNIDYDIGVYERLVNLITNKNFIDCLKKEEINECKNYFSDIGEVEFQREGNIIKVDVEAGELYFEKIKIKFAVDNGKYVEVNNNLFRASGGNGVDDYIKEASNQFSVDEKIIRAIIERESNFNINVGCNKVGACGLMQIREVAYNEVKRVYNVGYSWKDAKSKHRENILTGTAYFKIQYDIFNQDLKLALAAYNWGIGNVNDNCKTKNFEECKNVPAETANYVKHISERVDSLFG